MLKNHYYGLSAIVSVLTLMLSLNGLSLFSQETPLARQGTEAGQRAVLNYEGMELAFRWCPAGSFTMGSPASEIGRIPDPWEKDHKVTLTKGFWIMETEVTQKLFQKVMGRNPSFWKGEDRPVEMIGIPACTNFCKKFAKTTGLAAQLPTEAQWEYACRAGTNTPFSSGIKMTEVDMQCRKAGTNPDRQTAGTRAVRSFKPNPWGLYDIHGNVAEWVADSFDPEYYLTAPINDPPGPSTGADCVLRGGGWSSLPDCCRSASRNLDVSPYSLSSSYGFRFIVFPNK